MRLLVLFLLLCFPGLAEGATKVLIVDGFSNHDWKRTTANLVQLLNHKGGYDVEVSTFPVAGTKEEQEKWCPEFSRYDVLIQNSNGGPSGGIAWPEEARRNLEKYIAGGGGMMAFHSANNAFREWKEYNRMIGLAWRDAAFGTALVISPQGEIVRIPPGEGRGTSHGERIDALVTRLADHPITRGLPRQWRAADIEVYSYARGPAENVTVVSYAKEPVTGLNFPIEWTVSYGRGRVYTSTLGHVWTGESNLKGVQCAGFQTLFFRALDWLSGKRPDSSVPADFPTIEKTSLRKIPDK